MTSDLLDWSLMCTLSGYSLHSRVEEDRLLDHYSPLPKQSIKRARQVDYSSISSRDNSFMSIGTIDHFKISICQYVSSHSAKLPDILMASRMYN